MIAAAIALLASVGIPIATGGTLGGLFAFFATPGGGVAKLILKSIVKAGNRPLTADQKQRLRAYHEEMARRPVMF